MTTPPNSAEPTMDEILASIRRIVSDEPVFGRAAAEKRGVNPLIEPRQGGSEPASGAAAHSDAWRPIARPPLPVSSPAGAPVPAAALAPVLPPPVEKPGFSQSVMPQGMPPLTSVAPPGPAPFERDLDDLLEMPPLPISAAEPKLPPPGPSPAPRKEDSKSIWSRLRSDPAVLPPSPPALDMPKLPEPSAPASTRPAEAPPSPPQFLPSFGTAASAPRSSSFFPPLRDTARFDLPPQAAASPAPEAAKSLDEVLAEIKSEAAAPPPPPPSLSPVKAPELPAAAPLMAAEVPAETAPEPVTASVAPPAAEPAPALEVARQRAEEPVPAAAEVKVEEPPKAASKLIEAAPAPAEKAPEPAPAVPTSAAKETSPAVLAAPSEADKAPAEAPTAAPRGLEDMITDMVRPMLEKWIAENMPRIVEKALRGGIKK